MQFTSAILSVLALSLPTALAQQTEPNAVKITIYDNLTACRLGLPVDSSWYPDGKCFHLSKSRMDVASVAETCRVFIYENDSCTGYEKQVYGGNMCVDIKKYFGIKVFCH